MLTVPIYTRFPCIFPFCLSKFHLPRPRPLTIKPFFIPYVLWTQQEFVLLKAGFQDFTSTAIPYPYTVMGMQQGITRSLLLDSKKNIFFGEFRTQIYIVYTWKCLRENRFRFSFDLFVTFC